MPDEIIHDKDTVEWMLEHFPLADIKDDYYEPPEVLRRQASPPLWQTVWSDYRSGWYVEGPAGETQASAIVLWNEAMRKLKPAPRP